MFPLRLALYSFLMMNCTSLSEANTDVLNDFQRLTALDNLILKALKEQEKRTPAAKKNGLDEWENYSFIPIIISNTHASSLEEVCFFGGWPSKTSEGRCLPPYKKVVRQDSYIKSLGSTYTRAQYCGSENLLRCPHELFGEVSPGKGPCVQAESRLDFTTSCINYAKKNQTKRILGMKANYALYKKYMKRAELILKTCIYSSNPTSTCIELRNFLSSENNLMCELKSSSSPSSVSTLSDDISSITMNLRDDPSLNFLSRANTDTSHIPFREKELYGNAEQKYPSLKESVLLTITKYLDMNTFCKRHNKFRRQCLGTAAGFSTALIEGISENYNLKRKNKKPYIHYSDLKKIKKINGKKVRGRTIPEINSPEFRQVNAPGMMIHTRCNCKRARWSYDKKDDAHHWTVYAGIYDGRPMYFDNTSESMFKGCRKCKKDKIKNCKKTAQCLKDCREKHRVAGTAKDKWCDPENPKTCLMSGKKYELTMSQGGWANVKKYCKKGKNPCVHSIRNPFSDLK